MAPQSDIPQKLLTCCSLAKERTAIFLRNASQKIKPFCRNLKEKTATFLRGASHKTKTGCRAFKEKAGTFLTNTSQKIGPSCRNFKEKTATFLKNTSQKIKPFCQNLKEKTVAFISTASQKTKQSYGNLKGKIGKSAEGSAKELAVDNNVNAQTAVPPSTSSQKAPISNNFLDRIAKSPGASQKISAADKGVKVQAAKPPSITPAQKAQAKEVDVKEKIISLPKSIAHAIWTRWSLIKEKGLKLPGGMPPQVLGVIAIIIVVVAAAFVITNNNGSDDREKPIATVKLTMGDSENFRVGDSIVKTLTSTSSDQTAKATSSKTIVKYIITYVDGDNYTVHVSQRQSNSTSYSSSFTICLSGFDIESIIQEDLSDMTDIGPAIVDTKYGKVRVTQYQETDSDGNVTVHNIIGAGYCISRTTTSADTTTTTTLITTSTMFIVDEIQQKAETISTRVISVSDEVEEGEDWKAVTVDYKVSNRDYSWEASSPSEESYMIDEISGRICNVWYTDAATGVAEEKENFSISRLEVMYTTSDSNFRNLTTPVGTGCIYVQFSKESGYVSCDVYKMEKSGKKYDVYVEPDTKVVLMTVQETEDQTTNQTTYQIAMMVCSLWSMN